MRKSRIFTALAIMLIVGACATSSDPRLAAVERVTLACNGYAATLDSLSTLRAAGQLSAAKVATVDEWEPFLTETCLAPAGETVTGDILNRVERGMLALISVRESSL